MDSRLGRYQLRIAITPFHLSLLLQPSLPLVPPSLFACRGLYIHPPTICLLSLFYSILSTHTSVRSPFLYIAFYKHQPLCSSGPAYSPMSTHLTYPSKKAMEASQPMSSSSSLFLAVCSILLSLSTYLDLLFPPSFFPSPRKKGKDQVVVTHKSSFRFFFVFFSSSLLPLSPPFE